MRILFCLIVFAATAGAQWHRLDEARPAAPSSLGREMLAGHNAVRARVRLAPLEWSDRLAQGSREWADTLLAHHQFVHSPHPSYGENLFEITGAPASSAQVVDMWAAESRNYDDRSNTCKGVCGHYTQIVWRDTKQVGCGVARGGQREVWVCRYNPPGNWIGRRPY